MAPDWDFSPEVQSKRQEWYASRKSRFLTGPSAQFGMTSGFADARRLKPEARQSSPLYRNSSITASNTSLPGRVTDSGSVASG